MVEQTLSKAQSQARKGNISNAIALCEKILALYPENKRAKNAITKLRRQNVQPVKTGLQNWQKKLKTLSESQDYSTFYREAKKFSAEYPSIFEAWLILGTAAAQFDQLEEAKAALNNAIQLKPDSIEAQNNLGLCHIKSWQFEEAIIAFEKIISVKPNYAEAHGNKGVALFKLGKYVESVASFETAISIRPDFNFAHANLGRALQKQGLLQKAESCLLAAIRLNKLDVNAYYSLSLVQIERNEQEKAKKSLQKALSVLPTFQDAQHLLAALNGQANSSVPCSYIENLFDDYAPNFDHHLLQNLSYNTPKRLFEIITKKASLPKAARFLDLGCGTGLFGEQIYKSCEAIDGVDLSRGMLEKAKQKNIYKNLYQSDITQFLIETELAYDFFIFADVFVYVGDLAAIFELIKTKVNAPAKIAFSTEHGLGEGYFLQTSGRYCHSFSYIEQLCRQFHFDLQYFEEIDLRKDKGTMIQGGVYLLQHQP